MHVGGRLGAVEFDDGRPSQVLMGVQTGERLSPLRNEGRARDRVGLTAEQGAVVAVHGLVKCRLYPAPLMVIESEEEAGDRIGDVARHSRSPAKPSSPSQLRT
jgi:hypothetical protein